MIEYNSFMCEELLKKMVFLMKCQGKGKTLQEVVYVL